MARDTDLTDYEECVFEVWRQCFMGWDKVPDADVVRCVEVNLNISCDAYKPNPRPQIIDWRLLKYVQISPEGKKFLECVEKCGLKCPAIGGAYGLGIGLGMGSFIVEVAGVLRFGTLVLEANPVGLAAAAAATAACLAYCMYSCSSPSGKKGTGRK